MIGCHPFSATFEVVSKEKATAGHLQRVHCQDLGAEVHLKAWGHTETLHTFPDCRLFSCTDAQTLPESSGFTNKVWFSLLRTNAATYSEYAIYSTINIKIFFTCLFAKQM